MFLGSHQSHEQGCVTSLRNFQNVTAGLFVLSFAIKLASLLPGQSSLFKNEPNFYWVFKAPFRCAFVAYVAKNLSGTNYKYSNSGGKSSSCPSCVLLAVLLLAVPDTGIVLEPPKSRVCRSLFCWNALTPDCCIPEVVPLREKVKKKGE